MWQNQMVGGRRMVNGRELNPWSYGINPKNVVPEPDTKKRTPTKEGNRRRKKTSST